MRVHVNELMRDTKRERKRERERERDRKRESIYTQDGPETKEIKVHASCHMTLLCLAPLF